VLRVNERWGEGALLCWGGLEEGGPRGKVPSFLALSLASRFLQAFFTRLVVPKSWKTQVLPRGHDKLSAGHCLQCLPSPK
jgi:hypothetical protein